MTKRAAPLQVTMPLDPELLRRIEAFRAKHIKAGGFWLSRAAVMRALVEKGLGSER